MIIRNKELKTKVTVNENTKQIQITIDIESYDNLIDVLTQNKLSTDKNGKLEVINIPINAFGLTFKVAPKVDYNEAINTLGKCLKDSNKFKAAIKEVNKIELEKLQSKTKAKQEYREELYMLKKLISDGTATPEQQKRYMLLLANPVK